MNVLQLQQRLRASNRYLGALDGIWGPQTQAAVVKSLSDGPDTALQPADFNASAQRLWCDPKAIKAVTMVEASGAGFFAGEPVILFEPHIFSKLTSHQFDASHPTVSYPTWGMKPYPGTQAGRYAQLLEAVSLNVDAGFAAASYGRFQCLGENYAACGFTSSFDMAEAMAMDEVSQLKAFEGFVTANHLVHALASHDWITFARGYNGTAAVNNYSGKLAAAYQATA